MSVKVNQVAPNFTTEAYFSVNDEVKKITLSDYKGKWVILFFYPADFTFVCPTELIDIAENYDEFKNISTEVIGISIDTVYSHKVWVETELSKMLNNKSFPFPLASDLSGKIGQLYGVYDENTGLDMRGTFIIDPDGVIQSIEINNAPVGRDSQEIIRKLKGFQYVRASGGNEVCPARWKPGKKSIKPSIKIAGKVYKEAPSWNE
ncbi:MAG: thioredoxin-dependent peroxiredoxin [Endomicrobiia bacterium]